MELEKSRIMLGIDPDITENGIAFRLETDRSVILLNMDFWGLIEWIEDLRQRHVLYVVLEAGHLNKKSNFRSNKTNSLSSDRISKNVGQNHQVGILLSEYFDRHKIRYDLHIPRNKEIKKCIEDGDYFKRIFNWSHTGNFNKETRSAAMLIYQSAYPINLGKEKTPSSR